MKSQDSMFRKEELKHPAVLFFFVVYIFAVVIGIFSNASQAFVYIGMSAGIVILLWFLIFLTQPLNSKEIRVRQPALELLFAVAIYLAADYIRLPQVGFGKEWAVNSIIRNNLFYLLLPILFLVLRGYSIIEMGLSFGNLKQILKVGILAFLCMSIPSAIFIGNVVDLFIDGKLPVLQAVFGFFILFSHNVILAGLPEELFFRVFVQTRLCSVFKSNLAGILITAMLFGSVHIPAIQRWYPEMTFAEVLARAFFIQGITSLVEGVLWARTHSLLPGIIVHSGINALNNLGRTTQLFSACL